MAHIPFCRPARRLTVGRYVLHRLVLFVPLLLGTTLLVFAYVQLIPGGPVEAMLGVHANPKLVADIEHRYGLDLPWPEQYARWLGGALTGDLGVTVRNRISISDLLLARVPATLQLALGGFVVGLGIAVPLAVLSGQRAGSKFDGAVNAFALVGLAIPVFISGTLLLLLFAVKLKWFPVSGHVPLTENPLDSLRHMVLPSITLGLGIAPYFIRVIRTEVGEVMREPHLPYATSKGLRSRVIVWRYIVRNTLPRVVVLIGLLVGGLLGGSVFVEVVYNWPGMGSLLVNAVVQREYLLIQAAVLIYAIVFAVANLAAELLQGLLDPRVREF
jgi:peptide/nickel transport system permease protein